MLKEYVNNELKRKMDNDDERIAFLIERDKEYRKLLIEHNELLHSLNKTFSGRRILKKNNYVVKKDSDIKSYSGNPLEIIEKEEKTSH